MRVAEVTNGWGLDNLAVSDREIPTPGADEVLVRVTAASLNFRDWLMISGQYNPRLPLPLIPGSDGAGVVEQCGPAVTRFAPGDRVTATFFRDWTSGTPNKTSLRSSLGGPVDGALTQYYCAPQHSFVRSPAHLSDVEAATLPCAAVTAWSALVTHGQIKAGDTVLVLGTGGVSMFALQFAKMHGARVIATSSSDEKLEVLRRDFGVTETINYRSEPEWGRRVREMSGGGVDHVVEVGGAGTIQRSMKAVRPGGSIYLIGVLAGPTSDLNLTPVLMRNIRIQGVIVGPRQSFEEMNRAVEANEMRPLVDRRFPLEQIREAFEYLVAAQHMGKIVVEL